MMKLIAAICTCVILAAIPAASTTVDDKNLYVPDTEVCFILDYDWWI